MLKTGRTSFEKKKNGKCGKEGDTVSLLRGKGEGEGKANAEKGKKWRTTTGQCPKRDRNRQLQEKERVWKKLTSTSSATKKGQRRGTTPSREKRGERVHTEAPSGKKGINRRERGISRKALLCRLRLREERGKDIAGQAGKENRKRENFN